MQGAILVYKKMLRNNSIKIIDIGASGGLNSRWDELEECIFPILFEPDFNEYEKIKDNMTNKGIVINKALSNKEKTIDFYVCRKQQVSSVYKPNRKFLDDFPDSERFDVLKTLRIEASTLDVQLDKNNINDIDFIKIDTQGHELAILEGAVQTLEDVIGIELEIEFLEMYEGQPLFNEVNGFLHGENFKLMDLRGHFWRKKKKREFDSGKGQLIYGDTLYMRDPKTVCSYENISEDKLIRAALLYHKHGYRELMEELIELAFSKGLMTKEIYNKLEQLLQIKNLDEKTGASTNGNHNYHMKEEIVKKINYIKEISGNHNRKVYVYGVGGLLEVYYNLFEYENFEISGFIDSDENKVNTYYKGKKINNKTYLHRYSAKENERPFIIITSSFIKEIEFYLDGIGFRKYIDYI